MSLFVVADADVVARRGEGIPGYVEPAVAGEELVGVLTDLQELHELPELGRVFGADVGGLTDEVLGAGDTAYFVVHGLAPETGIDDDGTDQNAGRLQQQITAESKIRHDLHRGNILRVLPQLQKLAQLKMLRQSNVIKIIFHGVTCS